MSNLPFEEYVIRFITIYFFLNEHPSVNLALPPVGAHKTVEQLSQLTAVWAWEKTVVMFKHPWHLTSMKYDLGSWTKVFNLWLCLSVAGDGCNKSWTKTILRCNYLFITKLIIIINYFIPGRKFFRLKFGPWLILCKIIRYTYDKWQMITRWNQRRK